MGVFTIICGGIYFQVVYHEIIDQSSKRGYVSNSLAFLNNFYLFFRSLLVAGAVIGTLYFLEKNYMMGNMNPIQYYGLTYIQALMGSLIGYFMYQDIKNKRKSRI
ncbi:MAG: hypothetical protein QXO84_02580 [Candidatus Aenigmatarchaeota archaeon]